MKLSLQWAREDAGYEVVESSGGAMEAMDLRKERRWRGIG
jgi:hypothetical protein